MVIPIPWMTMAQAAPPDLVAPLERIMWAQTIMAAATVLITLALLAVAVAILLLVRRAMDRIEAAKDQMLPHLTPVLSRASTIADDVGHITAGFRDNADDVQETVQDLLIRTRGAVDSLEERVRRFGAVLEAVQDQAELMLMDATAKARGAQTTARALRNKPARPGPTSRRDAND